MDVEVKRKSIAYGFLVILFAILISSFCFKFGIQSIYHLYSPDIGRFSSHLHSYDEDHIIGIGLEDGKVKLSLFDVSNVAKPIELLKYIVEGESSSILVLQDHKAFLFDKSMKLLVIPVSVSISNVFKGGYVTSYWQGSYVFQLDLESGFILRGKITHQSNVYDCSGKYFIRRALYIGEFLYIISNVKIVVKCYK